MNRRIRTLDEFAIRHTTNNNKRSLVNKWKSVHCAILLYAITASHIMGINYADVISKLSNLFAINILPEFFEAVLHGKAVRKHFLNKGSEVTFYSLSQFLLLKRRRTRSISFNAIHLHTHLRPFQSRYCATFAPVPTFWRNSRGNACYAG